ncbi:lytic murein transglycosylase [Candidatus Endowatersipora endosymbiont of Watersipora subatra]|uniref:lytic murein transglycosylase n=1 Tax=Candidatus Endowatersipora endosymbiont of Watersipora subatra TaxID=3077946 RepID=UPI00312C9565
MNHIYKISFLKLRILAFVSISIGYSIFSDAQANTDFGKWIKDFETVALQNGISRSTYKKSFIGIISPDPEIISLVRSQPEFDQNLWMYFDNRVNQKSISRGQEMERKWNSWLHRLEKQYGVSRYILLAIWSMETDYGEALKKDESLRSVIRSLATLAYFDEKRRKFAYRQLIAAMKIVQRGIISPKQLRGSWAGAMGHTQFIPTSYLAYAQDANGDGKQNIWTSVPDALATAANLLHCNGWKSGKPWGYEISIPDQLMNQKGKERSIASWVKLGVKRVNGKPFPTLNDRGVLSVPTGKGGPAFVMTRNFFVIKRYNNADKYALAVGYLADQIAGSGEFKNPFPRPLNQFTFEERREFQTLLSVKGFYNGEIDGKFGIRTRRAIRKAQESLGINPDGLQSFAILKQLRDQR